MADKIIDLARMGLLYVGIPTLVGVIVVIARRFQKIDEIDYVIKNEIRPEMKDFRIELHGLTQRVASVETKIDYITKTLDVLVAAVMG